MNLAIEIKSEISQITNHHTFCRQKHKIDSEFWRQLAFHFQNLHLDHKGKIMHTGDLNWCMRRSTLMFLNSYIINQTWNSLIYKIKCFSPCKKSSLKLNYFRKWGLIKPAIWRNPTRSLPPKIFFRFSS